MKNLLLRFTLALFIAIASTAVAANGERIYHDGWIDLNKNGKMDVYEDANQPVASRVKDLMSLMTNEEKIGQLAQSIVLNGKKSVEAATALSEKGELSSCLYHFTTLDLRNQAQRAAVEKSRLGIPLLFGHDSIHGFRTIFPIPLAMACAWEPSLFEKAEAVSARESSAAGIDWVFAPMVDLARDPRWGRIAEGYGEDPWLGSQYAAAAVRGFQGKDLADLKNPARVIACLKHYVGYGAAEGGRDYNTTEITEYTLRNFYLPQFKAGVDAGALTLMSAFNCNGGTPSTANRHTLTDILRGEWKFKGFVVSDWEGVSELKEHGVAADDADAAKLALNAGVDMEMLSTTYRDSLPALLKSGAVSQATLDEAVRRVLRVKFEKGVFDRPYDDQARLKNAFLKPDAVALAREAAEKSCVLLKNEHNALPISLNAKRIALIGPMGNDQQEMLGCWHSYGKASDAVTLASGLRATLPKDAKLDVVKGCNLIEGKSFVANTAGKLVAVPGGKQGKTGSDNFQAAIEAAKKADVVIMALGEPAAWDGENASRCTLGITGRQPELFDAIAALGKPVIVVLFNGRPLAIQHLQDKAAAILEAWSPGVQAGPALVDLLTGKANPSGRLTVTFPRSIGQIPVYYNHLNTGRPQWQENYRDGTASPLYPFGYGLSYATFAISDAKLSASQMSLSGSVTVSATVQNAGKRAGDEVAQFYIRCLAASAGARPVRELRGFKKVYLNPGESREVKFTVNAKTLGYYAANGHWLCDPGKYQLWISQDSASGKPVELEVGQ